MSDMQLIAGRIFSILTDIFNLITSQWLLTGFLALWLIRRVTKLFRHI